MVLGTNGEVTGAGVGVVRVTKDGRDCGGLRIGDSGRAAAPGMPSEKINRLYSCDYFNAKSII